MAINLRFAWCDGVIGLSPITAGPPNHHFLAMKLYDEGKIAVYPPENFASGDYIETDEPIGTDDNPRVRIVQYFGKVPDKVDLAYMIYDEVHKHGRLEAYEAQVQERMLRAGAIPEFFGEGDDVLGPDLGPKFDVGDRVKGHTGLYGTVRQVKQVGHVYFYSVHWDGKTYMPTWSVPEGLLDYAIEDIPADDPAVLDLWPDYLPWDEEGQEYYRSAATVEDSEPAKNFGFLQDPHADLYPCAFEGDNMRDIAIARMKEHVFALITGAGVPNPNSFIYFTVYGSGASYNWDEDGDFDVQMWVDSSKYNEQFPDDPKTPDDLLADVRRGVQLGNFPSFKDLGLDTPDCEGKMLIQFYPKLGTGSPEENLASKPYACYDMEADEWLQRPEPLDAKFYGEAFLLVLPKAEDIAMQAEAHLGELDRNTTNWQFWSQMYDKHQNARYLEQAEASREKATLEKEGVRQLFQGIFGGRQEAYSPTGKGIHDERDVIEKMLEVWGIFQALRTGARTPLPWEDHEMPEAPKTSAKLPDDPWNDPDFLAKAADDIYDWTGGYGDYWEIQNPRIPFMVLEDGRYWIGWDAHSHSHDWMIEDAEQELGIKDYWALGKAQGSVNFADGEYQVNWPQHNLHRELEPMITKKIVDYVEQNRRDYWNESKQRLTSQKQGSPRQRMIDRNRGDDLVGLPSSVNVPGVGDLNFGSHKELQDIARNYMERAGVPYDPPRDYVRVNPTEARQIADEYERMPHAPDDPKVNESYRALINETLAQYQALIDAGYTFDFEPPGESPYASPREALLDLHENKHLYVYPTALGFGEDEQNIQWDHPLLGDSGIRWSGIPVTYNDLFRAVHDVFGHAKEGVGFRHDGEENAWRQHLHMYSPTARPAMTAETRGQNSWVNFGPMGEANQLADQANTVYAEQKAGILPEWTHKATRNIARTAAWEDVQADAEEIYYNGNVHLTVNNPDYVEGTVDSQSTPGQVYETSFSRNDPNSGAITVPNCTCPWGEVMWGRTRQWKKYDGRPCKHILALYWTSLANPVSGEDQAQPALPGAEVQRTPQRPEPAPTPTQQGPSPMEQLTIPGTLARRTAAFGNGEVVRAREPLMGYDDRTQRHVVPQGAKGEVLSSDETTTIAIFPTTAGPLGPHVIRVEAPTSLFVGATGTPFVQRRSTDDELWTEGEDWVGPKDDTPPHISEIYERLNNIYDWLSQSNLEEPGDLAALSWASSIAGNAMRGQSIKPLIEETGAKFSRKVSDTLPATYTPGDPYDISGKTPLYHKLQSAWWEGSPEEQRRAIANAFRSTMISPQLELKWNAVAYQALMDIPAEEDNPDVYEHHLRDWKRRWDNPGQTNLLDPNWEGLSEEETLPGSKLNPPFWKNVRGLSVLAPYIEDLRQAALEDLKEGGQGFRFRDVATAIPGIGPKIASFAWLILQPTTSELAAIDLWMMRHLGEKGESPNDNRYLELENKLREERDALYPGVPLGQYQWAVWDKLRTPGAHQDHSPFRVQDPTSFRDVNWSGPSAVDRAQALRFAPKDVGDHPQLFAKTAISDMFGLPLDEDDPEVQRMKEEQMKADYLQHWYEQESQEFGQTMDRVQALQEQGLYDAAARQCPHSSGYGLVQEKDVPEAGWHAHGPSGAAQEEGDPQGGQPGFRCFDCGAIVTGINGKIMRLPEWIPRKGPILNKLGMAERTGDPELDALIEKFIEENPDLSEVGSRRYERLPGDLAWSLDQMREPERAGGMCGVVSTVFGNYLKAHGSRYKATTNGNWSFMNQGVHPGYYSPDELGYTDRPNSGYGGHCVVFILDEQDQPRYSIDFTAAQYGYKEFPMVQRLLPDANYWQRHWSSVDVQVEPIPENMDQAYRGVGFNGDGARFSIYGPEYPTQHPYFQPHPGLQAFVDIYVNPGTVRVAFLNVEGTHGGQGMARRLMQYIYDMYPEQQIIWGRSMDDAIDHLKGDFTERYPDRTAALEQRELIEDLDLLDLAPSYVATP